MPELLRVRCAGTGSAVPDRIMPNSELEQMVETNDEWITSRTGIKERRITAEGEATSDLALRAAQRACENAKVDPKDIELVICATISPDYPFPATAAIVAARLGATRSGAFDLEAACTGFVYGLSVGWKFVQTGMYRNVLVVGADVMSRITDFTDRNTCVLFGDGAGAVVLQPSTTDSDILSASLYADGSRPDIMWIPTGGSRVPTTPQTVAERGQFLRIKGREVYKFAVTKFVELTQEALERNRLTMDQVALVIPHQVNLRIIEASAERLHTPLDKFYINIQKYGNTSGGSVPLALDEAARSGRLRRGDLALLIAFGAGLTWGSALLRW
ncbi:MAG: ketoacyl-ACP synthase III [Planctomycetes bacterium]|nr:ketoacyl-ACP synthase III [Planctomycetota bacterium]